MKGKIILDVIEIRKDVVCENCDRKSKVGYGCCDGIMVVELQLCPQCFKSSNQLKPSKARSHNNHKQKG